MDKYQRWVPDNQRMQSVDGKQRDQIYKYGIEISTTQNKTWQHVLVVTTKYRSHTVSMLISCCSWYELPLTQAVIHVAPRRCPIVTPCAPTPPSSSVACPSCPRFWVSCYGGPALSLPSVTAHLRCLCPTSACTPPPSGSNLPAPTPALVAPEVGGGVPGVDAHVCL